MACSAAGCATQGGTSPTARPRGSPCFPAPRTTTSSSRPCSRRRCSRSSADLAVAVAELPLELAAERLQRLARARRRLDRDRLVDVLPLDRDVDRAGAARVVVALEMRDDPA